MKKFRTKISGLFVIALFAISALLINFVVQATTVIDDTFADGISTNQNLAGNSLAIYKSRTGTSRTDAVGSVELNMTAAAGADGHWAYFTNSGSPVTLGVGDSLGFTGTFSLTGVKNIGSDIRFGLFKSSISVTRQTSDLTNGHSSTAFADSPGYGAAFVVGSTGNTPFTLYRHDASSQNNVFTSFTGNGWTKLGDSTAARQPLADTTSYDFNYTIERLSATQTRLTISVTGGTLTNLNYTVTETSATPNTSFDYPVAHIHRARGIEANDQWCRLTN